MKLVLFVEGPERGALPKFFKRWLDPRLDQPIGIKVVRFEGARDYLKDIARKVALNLTGDAGADVRGAIGLLDLYGLSFQPHEASVSQRYQGVKSKIERLVQQPRFRQHFAVHEIEAWLLAEPGIFPSEVRSGIPGTPPEQVDFHNPPASLLERLYRQRLGRDYRKVIDGYNLFGVLQPHLAAQRCPHLDMLLNDMLTLAKPDR